MRIGELSRRSGVGIPAIKFYLRMGLLSPGETTARNQAAYGPIHLRRLHLVDALIGVGGLSVAGTRAVLAAVDDTRRSPAELLRAVDEALPTRHPHGGSEHREAAGRAVTAAIGRGRWREPAARDRLVDAYVAAEMLGLIDLQAALDRYVATSAAAAACDVAVLRAYQKRKRIDRDPADPAQREALVAVAVLGAVLHSAMTGLACHEALARFLSEPGQTDRERG